MTFRHFWMIGTSWPIRCLDPRVLRRENPPYGRTVKPVKPVAGIDGGGLEDATGRGHRTRPSGGEMGWWGSQRSLNCGTVDGGI